LHPSPSVIFDTPLSTGCVINANLYDLATEHEIKTGENSLKIENNVSGFQAGMQKVLTVGGTEVQFAGLKLNKMTKIKNDLKFHSIKMDSFFIRFTVDNLVLDSVPFKIVSSCSQLPNELRELVRPAKKKADM
jgi:hypothetical protein